MLKQATLEEAGIAAELASLLWTGHSVEEFIEDMHQFISSENTAIFLAYEGEEAIGFAQCQLRNDYVEGTDSTPVGYLEGLFIKEAFRQQGYARLLVTYCEQWAKRKGCIEFASDCELHNEDSLVMHLRLGFIESNRIICFTKKL